MTDNHITGVFFAALGFITTLLAGFFWLVAINVWRGRL